MPTDLTGAPTSLGIGTYNTSADAPSGLGFNAAMAQIDALLLLRVNKPAGVATGDVPVWNGTTWVVPGGSRTGSKFLRDDGSWQTPSGGLTPGLSFGQTISAANTDLAWPGGTSPAYTLELQTGGGSLRSLGAPTTSFARFAIFNTASAITLKHNTGGGTGLPLLLNGSQDKVLHVNETVEFVSDGSFWREVSYNPIEVTGLIPAAGTTPTAGSGFTYTHTNGTGVYVITFTTAFVGFAPVISAQTSQGGTGIVSGASTSGFTMTISGAADAVWNFRAVAVR